MGPHPLLNGLIIVACIFAASLASFKLAAHQRWLAVLASLLLAGRFVARPYGADVDETLQSSIADMLLIAAWAFLAALVVAMAARRRP